MPASAADCHGSGRPPPRNKGTAMNRTFLKLLEKHAEKYTLWMAAGVLAAMIALFGLRSPNRVTLGEPLTPAQLSGAILEQAVDLKRRMASASPAQVEPDAAREFTRRLVETPALPHLSVVTTLGGRPVQVAGLDDEPAVAPIALVRPPAPVSTAVATGRNLVLAPAGDSAPPAATPRGGEAIREIAWVSVGGFFDISALQTAMLDAGYEPGRARVYIAGTDVERREQLASGEWGGWMRVEGSGAMPRFQIPAPVFDERGRLLNSGEMGEAWRGVRDGQVQRMQPPFPPVIAGPEWSLPPLVAEPEPVEETERGPAIEPPPAGGLQEVVVRRQQIDPARMRREAQKQLAAAKQALARSDRATARTRIEAVLANPHASASVRSQAERIQRMLSEASSKSAAETPAAAGPAGMKSSRVAVWSHDDTVEAGKTYQYRLRVNVWNRYLGRLKAVRDADDARRAIVEGDWSAPSAPIVAAPSSRFFVTGLKPDGTAAVVEVWKWRKGVWHKQYFDAPVGETIGGPREVAVDDLDATGGKVMVDFSTGALVLDLRSEEAVSHGGATARGGSEPAAGKSIVLVYADGADGQVKERVDATDRADPVRKSLQAGEKKTGRP